jgi:hypothetical protein
MTLIHVPRPPKSAFYKDRPVSSLLKNQIRHLQEAEFNLIKTEGEAAEYIRRVTALLHPQGAPKPQIVRRRKAQPGRVKEIAAAASRKAKGPSGRKTKATPKRRREKAVSKRKRNSKNKKRAS